MGTIHPNGLLSCYTRMHSSRMRTALALTICCLPGGGGGVCTWSRGGGTWSGGVPGPGRCVPGPGGVCTWSQGGVPGPGGCTWSWGGVYLVWGGTWSQGSVYLVPGGVYLVNLVCSVNRMTNWCKNITLPQTSFAGGKNILRSMRSLVPQSGHITDQN